MNKYWEVIVELDKYEPGETYIFQADKASKEKIRDFLLSEYDYHFENNPALRDILKSNDFQLEETYWNQDDLDDPYFYLKTSKKTML